MALVTEAIKFALIHHDGQYRKYSGDPYMVHPISVLDLLMGVTDDEKLLAAGVVHDTIEDGPTLKEDFVYGHSVVASRLGERVADLTLEVTNEFTKKRYPTLNRETRKLMEVERLGQISPDAQSIKLADMIDNVPQIAREDLDFAKIYVPEKEYLWELLREGNEGLRGQARAALDYAWEKIKS